MSEVVQKPNVAEDAVPPTPEASHNIEALRTALVEALESKDADRIILALETIFLAFYPEPGKIHHDLDPASFKPIKISDRDKLLRLWKDDSNQSLLKRQISELLVSCGDRKDFSLNFFSGTDYNRFQFGTGRGSYGLSYAGGAELEDPKRERFKQIFGIRIELFK